MHAGALAADSLPVFLASEASAFPAAPAATFVAPAQILLDSDKSQVIATGTATAGTAAQAPEAPKAAPVAQAAAKAPAIELAAPADAAAGSATQAAAAGSATQAPAAVRDAVAGVSSTAAAAGAVAAAPAEVPPEPTDLWSRIRRGFKMPNLENKRAQASTRWYASQPDYIARMSARASLYLFHIVEEIEKRGMPTELALLPFVESAMQPDAVSFAKAAGLWQFIPSTGKKYDLEQNLWKDERFGVIESTRAALDYLQSLYAEFGDWYLALAAYNYGEAGVERALAKARAAHRSVAYEDLRLPTETQFYVPKLQAIKNIVADPQRFGIELPAIPNEPYFVAFNKMLDMDVATAARLADMPLEDFRALNPAFNRPLIVGASSPTILVPADKADEFEANLASWQATGQPLASWTVHVLQPGETLAKVAERVGVSEAQLRSANHIPARYRAAPGSTILVPRDESTNDDIAPDFVQASFSLVPEAANLRQITYRVRRGDTLATVARRWHVNADDIVSWNQLHSMNLFAGQHLTLTVAYAPRAAAQPAVHHAVSKKKKAPAASRPGTIAASHSAVNAAAVSVGASRM
jgi:membrane-bound lytic murein transglycosylase D